MGKEAATIKAIWKKLARGLLCLIIFFGLLETGLRLGGFIFLYFQEHKNQVSLKNKNAYRILCLGESTTQGQYPPFLEEILNQQNIGTNFSVIDKGLVGTFTSAILDNIETYIDQYRPDMVVAMMGSNDQGAHIPHERASDSGFVKFYRSFKVYKLARLIALHWNARRNGAGANGKISQSGIDQEKQFIASDSRSLDDLRREERQLKRAIVKNFGNEDAHVRLGKLYSDQNWFQLSEECFMNAIRLNAKNEDAYLYLGRLYRDQGQMAPAEEAFKKVLELRSTSDDAYVGLADVYREQGRYSEAEENLQKALALNSKNVWVYDGLGKCYQARGRLDDAEVCFKKAITLEPMNDWLWLTTGNLYFKMGETHDAEVCFLKARDLNPRNSEAYAALGYLYQAQGRSQEAENFFKKALSTNPQHEEAYAWLKALFQDDMSFQQAIVQLEKDRGVDSTNDLAELYGALGTLYFGKGQTALAQEFYDRAERVRSASYNPITAENYRKLKRILDGKRIKLVCVQYPMRDVALLKKIFHGDDEGVLFVDNEKTFKEAVQKDGYKAYFVDMAGGDMGHCTETGNRLLAKNIADVILKKEFHR